MVLLNTNLKQLIKGKHMALPTYVKKTLKMKPEVTRIFDDLDQWLDYCRINLIKFDAKDLYRSPDYRKFQQEQEYLERKARREREGRPEPVKTREPRGDYNRSGNNRYQQ
jgi:hypothetical protein